MLTQFVEVPHPCKRSHGKSRESDHIISSGEYGYQHWYIYIYRIRVPIGVSALFVSDFRLHWDTHSYTFQTRNLQVPIVNVGTVGIDFRPVERVMYSRIVITFRTQDDWFSTMTVYFIVTYKIFKNILIRPLFHNKLN